MNFMEFSSELPFDVLVEPPSFDPDELVPVSHWGEFMLGMIEQNSGVILQILYVPEGVLHVAICPHCGGRLEYLLDLRRVMANASETGHPDPREIPGFVTSVLTLRARFTAWATGHEDCKTTPKPHVVPEAVQNTARIVEEMAREWIKKGNPVPPALYVVAREGVLIVPDARSSDYDTREQETQLLLFFIREHLRQNEMEVLGVVSAAEAWSVSGDPEDVVEAARIGVRNHEKRKEVFIVARLSNGFGEVATAGIEREEEGTEEGPGTIGELKFAPLGAPSAILDGLLAVDYKMDEPGKITA